jgi:xanthine/uracil/vitamin C permease (AzgA family)
VCGFDFDDHTELIPAFAAIALMSFTDNIGVGITAAPVLYPLFQASRRTPQRNSCRIVDFMHSFGLILRFLSISIGGLG